MHHYPPAPAFVTSQRGSSMFRLAALRQRQPAGIDRSILRSIRRCNNATVRPCGRQSQANRISGIPMLCLKLPAAEGCNPTEPAVSLRAPVNHVHLRARMHARTHADTQAGAHAHASLHFCVLTQRAHWRVARTHPNTATARTAAQRQRAHRDAHALRSARDDRWSVLL